ncbi:endonuclease III [bacterium AH-315-M10]|nr:endonuclease III [bacterium AH-315-M10]
MPAKAKPKKARRRKKRFDAEKLSVILEGLAAEYGDAECALRHRNPYELLIATILSAQCTDKRVNMVTPELFAQFPTPSQTAEAEPEQIEALIHSTGFYRNKTKSILGASRGLVENFGGVVPQTMGELLTLPGVARKTANVVLGVAFGIAEGVVVDTHVMRITGLLKMTRHSDPKKIELDLIDILPQASWVDFSHRLIWHGREVCIARRPNCPACVLREVCPSSKAQ